MARKKKKGHAVALQKLGGREFSKEKPSEIDLPGATARGKALTLEQRIEIVKKAAAESVNAAREKAMRGDQHGLGPAGRYAAGQILQHDPQPG